MNNVARGGFRPLAIRGLSFLLLISPYSAIPLSDFFRLHLTITSIVLVPVDHRLDKTIYWHGSLFLVDNAVCFATTYPPDHESTI